MIDAKTMGDGEANRMTLRIWLAGHFAAAWIAATREDNAGISFDIVQHEANLRGIQQADDMLAQLAKPQAERCEHGIADGEYCEPCNREYKRAAVENAKEEIQYLPGRK